MSKSWKYIFLFILVLFITVFFAFSVKQAVITSIICCGIITFSAYLYDIYPQFRKNNIYFKFGIFLVIAFIFSYTIWHGIEFSILCCLIDFAYIWDSKRAIDVDLEKENLWALYGVIDYPDYKKISLKEIENDLRLYFKKRGIKIIIKKGKRKNAMHFIKKGIDIPIEGTSSDGECLIIYSPNVLVSSINYYFTADKFGGKLFYQIDYCANCFDYFDGFFNPLGKALVGWFIKTCNSKEDAKEEIWMVLENINKTREGNVGCIDITYKD